MPAIEQLKAHLAKLKESPEDNVETTDGVLRELAVDAHDKFFKLSGLCGRRHRNYSLECKFGKDIARKYGHDRKEIVKFKKTVDEVVKKGLLKVYGEEKCELTDYNPKSL